MLVELAARTRWMFGSADERVLHDRIAAVRNYEKGIRTRLRDGLRSANLAKESISALLDPLGSDATPDAYKQQELVDRSVAVPSPSNLLEEFSRSFSEPGWLDPAYSLLSQVTHATPLGTLHSVGRWSEGVPFLSQEMTALSLDALCMGASDVLGSYAGFMARLYGKPAPIEWMTDLRRAAGRVRWAAQQIHFLG